MGAGKTSVGAVLAARWGVELRDTDARHRGESPASPSRTSSSTTARQAFRALERAAVARALARAHRCGRRRWRRSDGRREHGRRCAAHRVVFLDVGLSEAASRVGLGATRPLLLGNVRGQLKALLDARRPLYDEVAISSRAHRRARRRGRSPTRSRRRSHDIGHDGSGSRPPHPYDVVVGHGLLGELTGCLPVGVRRVAVDPPQCAVGHWCIGSARPPRRRGLEVACDRRS